jgi:hypothetical protein
MSILNPNVFFEFGIRTALDKPVALVIDDKTEKIPIDTSLINFHKYNGSLDVWTLDDEIKALAEHLRVAYSKSAKHNSLWKYFGIAQTGEFKPEASSLEDKIDLLMREVFALKRQSEQNVPSFLRTGHRDSVRTGFLTSLMGQQEESPVKVHLSKSTIESLGGFGEGKNPKKSQDKDSDDKR